MYLEVVEHQLYRTTDCVNESVIDEQVVRIRERISGTGDGALRLRKRAARLSGRLASDHLGVLCGT